jgi:hypothetical protein
MEFVGLVSGREMGVGHALVLETIFSVLPGPLRLLTFGNWSNTTKRRYVKYGFCEAVEVNA